MASSRSPTIKDVARIAGVSSATVSYVLNDLNKVSPEVDALVRRVAKDLGYSRNNAARALKTGRNNIIGCIVPTLTSPVFPEIAQAVQMRAEAHGYATLVIDSGNAPMREQMVVHTLAKHGVDGAVALLHPNFKLASPPLFPMVSLDAKFPGLDSVHADHYSGGRLMAEHAIALGHRRIGMLSGFQDLTSSYERRQGFVDAAAGRVELVWEVNVQLVPQLPPAAIEAIRRRGVTMIACVNDLVAIAALSVLKDSGMSAPGDVSVFGFDDMQWASWPLIDLTTIRQPLAELGSRATDLLVARLDNPDLPTEDVVLPVTLVERGSTSRIR